MATKTRPSLLGDSDMRGISVLEDLDAFLEEEEDSYLQGSDGQTSQPMVQDLGGCCMECRGAAIPLATAVSSGHRVCLQEMLSAQPELDLHGVRVENAATLCHLASRKGDMGCLQALLEADRSLCEVGDNKGATPLHVCAYHGHVDCLRCLLCAGRSGLVRDQDGATPVHFAAASGHTECLKVLIEEGGGDPNRQTNGGETPGEQRRTLYTGC
jgi:hypothetical protein